MRYYIRFSALIIFCVLFSTSYSFASFEEDIDHALKTAYTSIPPMTKKLVEASPIREKVPLAFNPSFPQLKSLSPHEGTRFFDDKEEQEKHKVYQIGLIFRGTSPSTIIYLDKEDELEQEIRIGGKILGFLDIKLLHNEETGQIVVYLDEVNFEAHVKGLGMGHVALTFFTQFVDALPKCNLAFLKLLSLDSHVCRLYEQYGFALTGRSLDKLEASNVDCDTFREDSSAAGDGSLEGSPLRMVRSKVTANSTSVAGPAGASSASEAQHLSPSKQQLITQAPDPVTPLKVKSPPRPAPRASTRKKLFGGSSNSMSEKENICN